MLGALVPFSSGNLVVDRRYAYAAAAAAQGDFAEAADLLTQTLELAPDWAPVWFALGSALAELAERDGDAGQRAAASRAFRTALDCDPSDVLGASVRLARLADPAAVAIAPAHVAALFDQYAARFDGHLTETLAYRAPALLRQAVDAACRNIGQPVRFAAVVDLGCGTGLAGAAFRDVAGRLSGVDLSAGMLREAERKGLYDRLVRDDVGAFLTAEPPGSADLLVAADVLVYVGDLASLFAAAAAALRPGGLLALSAQRSSGEPVALGSDLRYAHAPDYIVATGAAAGLTTVRLDPVSTRRDRGIDVPGLVAVLAKA